MNDPNELVERLGFDINCAKAIREEMVELRYRLGMLCDLYELSPLQFATKYDIRNEADVAYMSDEEAQKIVHSARVFMESRRGSKKKEGDQ